MPTTADLDRACMRHVWAASNYGVLNLEIAR